MGDGDALDMALLQAAGYVQPRGGRLLLVQVRPQLGRIVRERNERAANSAANYKAAVGAKKLGTVLSTSPYRDTSESFADFKARMIREGHLQAECDDARAWQAKSKLH